MAKKEYFEFAQGSVNGQILMNVQVFTTIAFKAVQEIEGVILDNLKGIDCSIEDDSITIDITVVIKYGNNVNKTIESLQAKVSQAIDEQIGVTVKDINVNVENIEF